MTETLLGRIVKADSLADKLGVVRNWLMENVFVAGTAMEIGAMATAFAIARFAAPSLRSALEGLAGRRVGGGRSAAVIDVIARQIVPIVWLILLWIMVLIAEGAGWPVRVMDVGVSLLAAWVVIRFAARVIPNRASRRTVAAVAWTIAALDIIDLLEPTTQLLDSIAVNLGDLRLSVLVVVKGVIALTILLWLSIAVANLIERRLRTASDLTPSMQVLFAKLLKIALVTIAIFAALSSVGIDLTAFAVFTGALGFGVGFGMQKIVSNLVSGVILLLDKSVKPGDVIAIGDTYGWVSAMGARYISLITRDGIEHLVPNEDLITHRVENWSYSNELIRQRISFGVSYKSDVRKAMELAIEAAVETPRVLDDPKPVCFIIEFGDSAVNFQLRVWIADPKNGVSNVKGAVLLRIWDKLHEHGIEIPFPQRDLHLRSPERLAVVTEPGTPG